MAGKKSISKKATPEKTIIGKIAGKAGYLAGELTAGKDHLVKMAGDAIESIKSTIQGDAAKVKAAPVKAALAKTKKAVTKQAIAVVKKSGKAAAKKVAPLKKAVKKVAKKAAGKK